MMKEREKSDTIRNDEIKQGRKRLIEGLNPTENPISYKIGPFSTIFSAGMMNRDQEKVGEVN
jgi:hypothetical protein